jgi:hypothetical protein
MPPVRLERDGDVAELILDAPPLNLFGAEVFDALEERSQPSRRRRAHRRRDLTSFETSDSVKAVQSFLQHGPGKAIFTGQ